jgi:hypothetical protein
MTKVEHEPSVHPKKRKDEDEDENEDDGCRHACVPTPYYRLFRPETQRRGVIHFSMKCAVALAFLAFLAFII